MGRLLPIRKPTPLAADDVYQRVSRGTKAAAQITRKLLSAERGDRLQNPAVRPAVVFVEQLNVLFSHGWEGVANAFVWGILPCPGRQAKPEMWAFLSHRRLTAYSEINERAFQFPDCQPLVQNRRICRAPRQHDAHTARASNQTESERKTFEAGFKSMQQGFTGTLDQLADCLAKA